MHDEPIQKISNIYQSAEEQYNFIVGPCPFTMHDIRLAQSHLFNNITTQDHVCTKIAGDRVYESKPGAIIASLSAIDANFNQDYFFHWIRDAAIVMDELAYWYEISDDPLIRENLLKYFNNYIFWNKIAQQQPAVNGINVLGEPKYNIDATLWQGAWSRPQNDGPALRVISLTHIANILLAQNKQNFISEHLFNKHLAEDKMGIIKTDLEYIAKHWDHETSGIWEESACFHFFTEAVQRRALIEGAKLATIMGDYEAAHYYLQQAQHLEQLIQTHWNSSTGFYSEVLQHSPGQCGGIDVAIILGALHGGMSVDNDLLALTDPKIISSAYFVRYAFEGLYRVNIDNAMHHQYGPLIGRYPNDCYDGNRSIYGNPWVFPTCNFAQYYYELAKILLEKQIIQISPLTWPFFQQVCQNINLMPDMTLVLAINPKEFLQIIYALQSAADSMLHAIKYHSYSKGDGDDFHLAEQIDRCSGQAVGAHDLAWNYSSILAAYRSRQSLIKVLLKF